MTDKYYIGETIYYPSDAVNFIVDLWRDFTNGDAFPVDQTEFPRMDEFILYLQNEGHFERLQGRWVFPNLDNIPYFWEFILSPVHNIPIDGQDDLIVPGAEVLLSPVDYGPGFEGFVRSLLYHMMNKNWVNDQMNVPGSGLELSTDVNFRARLLRFDGITCTNGYDAGEYYFLYCKGTPLKSVERKIKRVDDKYKLLLFDVPKFKQSDTDFCLYKILKTIEPDIEKSFNREYQDYHDALNACQLALKEKNWSIFKLKEKGDAWEMEEFYENIHKKTRHAFMIFIIGNHAKMTCIDLKDKPGNEYFRSKCGNCKEYVKLSNLHFDQCTQREQPVNIVNDVELKPHTMEEIVNMEQITSDTIERCIQTLRNKQSVYINGPGGSGKSRLIKRIQKEFPCQVLATTAEVARQFPGGQTVHSFFKLAKIEKKFKRGLRHVYEKDYVAYSEFINKEFQECPDYVVIDEAGMLAGQNVDTIDLICRGMKFEFGKYFGGISLVFVLDETQLPAIGSELCLFSTPAINFIRCIQKNVFTLNSPWRLRAGVQNDEDLLGQFNFLESVRFGIEPKMDFINFINRKDFDFTSVDGVVLVRTNDSAKKINRMIFPEKEFIKPWNNNPFEFYLGMQVICTSNVAKCRGAYKPINGERGKVVGTVNDTICVRFKDQECFFENYHENKKWKVDLVNARVITVHRSQGMTIEGKIYIEWFYGGFGFQHGMLYVALSRCTNLRNVHVIKKNAAKEQDFLTKNLKYSKLAISVAHDPTKLLPWNLVEKDGYYANMEKQKSRFVFKDKRYFKPRDIKCKRLLYDYKFEEYAHIFDHAIIVDHETANGLDGKQRPICTYVKYYVNGRPRQFNDLLKDYGNIPQHTSPKCKSFPKYNWDDDFKMMEFSLDYADEPIKELCNGICMIIEMCQTYQVNKMNMDLDWRCISKNPMTDWGFNNNGFDIFFFFKEYLESSKWKFTPTLINAGTTLKMFNLKVKDQVVFQTRDLMQLSGPGNFASATGSWCKNITRDLIRNEGLEKYITPFSPASFEDYCTERDTTLFSKNDLICDYNLFKNRKEQEERNLLLLAKNMKFYLVNGEITKGFAPLKLIVNNWGSTAEKWKSMPKVLDLVNKYGGEENFVNHCYFPREHKAVYAQIEKEGYKPFMRYDLKSEFKNYARLDVFLTELLMRAMNDVVYKFGQNVTMADGNAINIASSVGGTIEGTRTSLIRYSTTAQLVQQITFTNLPADCIKKDTGTEVETEMYLLPRMYDDKVNGILGGKTLARRMHFQSKGEDDYMQYLDFSGMYMKILEKYEYPYGPYNYITREHNLDHVKSLEEKFRRGEGEFFKRCALFKVKVKANENEIEPVYGVKRKNKAIKYSIEAEEVFVTNYELRVLYDYQVELIEIQQCLYWKSQTAMFGNVMKYYAELKNAAERNGDKVGRTFAKLMANSTFGTMAKSDKNECTMAWSTPQELLEIFKQYPACGKFLREPTIRGDYHMAKVQTNDGLLNHNIPYIGRFTLGASKIMLYDAIRIGYGENRFSDENFDNMLAYGDTDSITLHRKCVERLLDYDKTKEEKDQVLFYTNGNVNLKAGKLTDELLDDVDKYFNDKEYVKAIKKANRDWNDVANLRIVEMFNPAAKSGGVKFKVPAFGKYEERFGYKAFCKGIPKNAYVDVKVPKHLKHLKKPKGVVKMGHNKETYELFKFAYQHLLPLTSQRQDVLKKIMHPNSKEYEQALKTMDIVPFEEGAKTTWGNVMEETFIIDSKKRKHKTLDVSCNNGKRRRIVIGKEEIERVKQGEATMFEISSGQKLWHHFPKSNDSTRPYT